MRFGRPLVIYTGRLNDPEYQATFEHEAQKDISRIAWPETFDEFKMWRDLGSAFCR